MVRPHFDSDFYLRKNEDVRASGIDPIEHYCSFGWKEMRDPSPEFSTLYYLNSNPEVKDRGENPFVHYLTIGKAEGRLGKLPNAGSGWENKLGAHKKEVEPHFDPGFYLAQHSDIAESGADPLDHFMRFGWREGRDPSPYFSTRFYLAENPDISAAGVNPFWHYIVAGKAEGRAALPAFTPDEARDAKAAAARTQANAPSDADLKLLADHFDPAFYRDQRDGLEGSDRDLLIHFCTEGWKEGLDPSPAFSVKAYLDRYSDVAASSVNPLWHYVVAGHKEGRKAIRPDDYAKRRKSHGITTSIDDIRAQFDATYYLFQYPDVARAGADPVEHYWTKGWQEGRNPCASFSTTYYLETNPDVADLGINPFWHYVVAGRAEGRRPQHPGGYKVERLRKLEPLENDVRRWRHNRLPETLLSPSDLTRLIRDKRQGDKSALLISVGHDHYRNVSGGVQLCEYREEAISGSTGTVYLYIHPWQPLPRLADLDEDSDPIVALILDGENAGLCRIGDLVTSVAGLEDTFERTSVVIHHMLGHSPEHLADLVRATGQTGCWLWLHDFFTVCPSFTLQRNSVSYCGGPAVTSNACTLCKFGRERQRHIPRIRQFFDELDVHVLSPSEVTAETWTRISGLVPASLTVQPHMELQWRKRSTPAPAVPEKVTIGFLGTPASHKGWDVFEELFRAHADDAEGYRFVFLGATKPPAAGIDHHHVHVTAENPDAMIAAVREERVDLVLHWASWPETFSLSTYEAFAGGAYVITNPVSGNVAATVEKLGRGAVLQDKAELIAFFADGRARDMAETLRAERRKSEVHHRLSRMVHDAVESSEQEGAA